MKILISNDDGIHAIGIKILAEKLAEIAEVWVVAPDRNRSGASNSLTIQTPVRVQQLAERWYSVTGTPTDCVHLAVTGLFDTEFDMVVSGINAGANLGDDVLYSGTVAAATEGGILGIPSLAISLVGSDPQQNYATAAEVALRMVKQLQRKPLKSATILNVNVPDLPLNYLEGYSITCLGRRHRAAAAVKATDPRGYTIYWIGESGEAADTGTSSDFYAVQHKRVSVTPIKVDMTLATAMPELSHWLGELCAN